jgi:hypothetical protein
VDGLQIADASVMSYASGIDYSDTYLNYRYLFSNQQPGAQGSVPYMAGNISYANGWTYGSNFVSLDFEDTGNKDGANALVGLGDSQPRAILLVAMLRSRRVWRR